MQRRVIQGLAAAAASAVVASAGASVSTAITVSDLRVAVAALARDITPAVSFSSAIGSTSECDASFGIPAAGARRSFASGLAFGLASTSTSAGPFAAGSASISGNVFGAGALVETSAFASSSASQTLGEATLGLVDDVATASFTLAPWTVMTISANVRASASSTGANELEVADSGVLMAIGDSEGTGPQFAWVNFNAFAFGGLGPVDDFEATVVSLRYENASDAAISGVFSGYVASYASSDLAVDPVPEPGQAALLMTGLLLVAAAPRAWLGARRQPRVPVLPAQ